MFASRLLTAISWLTFITNIHSMSNQTLDDSSTNMTTVFSPNMTTARTTKESCLIELQVAIVGPLLKPTNTVIVLTREHEVYQFSFERSDVSSIGGFYQRYKKGLARRWPTLFHAMNVVQVTDRMSKLPIERENASRQAEMTNTEAPSLPQHITGLTVTGEDANVQYLLLSWSHDNSSRSSNWTNWSWLNLKSEQMNADVPYTSQLDRDLVLVSTKKPWQCYAFKRGIESRDWSIALLLLNETRAIRFYPLCQDATNPTNIVVFHNTTKCPKSLAPSWNQAELTSGFLDPISDRFYLFGRRFVIAFDEHVFTRPGTLVRVSGLNYGHFIICKDDWGRVREMAIIAAKFVFPPVIAILIVIIVILCCCLNYVERQKLDTQQNLQKRQLKTTPSRLGPEQRRIQQLRAYKMTLSRLTELSARKQQQMAPSQSKTVSDLKLAKSSLAIVSIGNGFKSNIRLNGSSDSLIITNKHK